MKLSILVVNGVVQVVKVEPYALPAAHKSLLELSRSLNRPQVPPDGPAVQVMPAL